MSHDDFMAFEQGSDLIKAGQFAQALPLLLESFTKQPHFLTATYLSLCYDAASDRSASLVWSGVAYALNPRHGKAATTFAKQLIVWDEECRAREVLEAALMHQPDCMDARELLAQLDGSR